MWARRGWQRARTSVVDVYCVATDVAHGFGGRIEAGTLLGWFGAWGLGGDDVLWFAGFAKDRWPRVHVFVQQAVLIPPKVLQQDGGDGMLQWPDNMGSR